MKEAEVKAEEEAEAEVKAEMMREVEVKAEEQRQRGLDNKNTTTRPQQRDHNYEKTTYNNQLNSWR